MHCTAGCWFILAFTGAPWPVQGLHRLPAEQPAGDPDEAVCSEDLPADTWCRLPKSGQGEDNHDYQDATSLQSVHGSGIEAQPDISETCNSKYPDSSLEHMAALFRKHTPKGRVFVALNLHQNVHIMANLEAVLSAFSARLGPKNVFLSVFESWSNDGTGLAVLKIQDVLRDLGVRTAVRSSKTGANQLVGQRFLSGNKYSKSNRIHWMARMRNAALDPLYKLQRRGERFDKVLFLNDVLVCEGDLWRLLALRADMACGFDFSWNLFYDTWAYDGQLPKGCIPEAGKSGALPAGGCVETPVQVKSCWSGMAAINPEAFYGGVRFRAGVLEDRNDCRDSECSLITRDMWRLGLRTILADPTVQVAYEMKGGYSLVHNMSEKALFDNRTDYIPAADRGDVHKRRCCALPETPGAREVNFTMCEIRMFNASSPAPYTKEWLQQFEVHWYTG